MRPQATPDLPGIVAAEAEPITDEQLRLAFRQLSRPGWPATPEAALAHPVYGPCLRGIARNLRRVGVDRSVPPPAQRVPAPPAPIGSRADAIATVRRLIRRHRITAAELAPPLPLFR